MRLTSNFTLNSLCKATQSYGDLPSDLPDAAALMEMLAVRVTGAASQPAASEMVPSLQAVYKVMLWPVVICTCHPACLGLHQEWHSSALSTLMTTHKQNYVEHAEEYAYSGHLVHHRQAFSVSFVCHTNHASLTLDFTLPLHSCQ